MFLGMGPGELLGVGAVVVGLVAWFIRLESQTKQNAAKIADGVTARLDSDLRHTAAVARVESDMRMYYATKQDVTRLEGMLNAVGVSTQQTAQAVSRVENKIDGFLVAAVQQQQKAG